MTQCEVTLNSCMCGYAGRRRCVSCGQPTCEECSTFTRRYYRWRRVRICADCIEDRADDIRAGRIVLRSVPKGVSAVVL